MIHIKNLLEISSFEVHQSFSEALHLHLSPRNVFLPVVKEAIEWQPNKKETDKW